MTYLRPNSRPYKTRAKYISAVTAFIIALLIIIQFVFPHLFPSIFTTIARPFWRLDFSIKNGSLSNQESLLSENAALKMQLDEATLRLDNIKSIEEENSSLLNILGRPVRKNATSTAVVSSTTDNPDVQYLKMNVNGRILAAVLIRPPFVGYDEMIIDIGKDFGLNIDDKIYAPGNVLIGRVVDVLEHSAKVSLFSSPDEKTTVLIGDKKYSGNAIGSGGGQYQIELPRDIDVNDGDLVYVSSISDRPFGKVTAVLSDPVKAFKTALFSSTVNIYDLNFVLVGVK